MRCARCGKVLDTQCKRVICNACMADIDTATLFQRVDRLYDRVKTAEAELARVQAVMTCAAEDLEARSSVAETGADERAMFAIARDLRAALKGKIDE